MNVTKRTYLCFMYLRVKSVHYQKCSSTTLQHFSELLANEDKVDSFCQLLNINIHDTGCPRTWIIVHYMPSYPRLFSETPCTIVETLDTRNRDPVIISRLLQLPKLVMSENIKVLSTVQCSAV